MQANARQRGAQMKGFELDLDEAAALLEYSKDAVAAMVEQGTLLARGSGDSLRISLDSIARYVGVHADQVAVQGAEQVFQDRSKWMRVFGAHPEMFAPADFELFSHTPVGGALRRAIAISEIRSV
jgi:hypothetical protein